MIIEFPRGVHIDLDAIPDDFEDRIRESFSQYTEGTAEDYTYQDKLAYIDRCRELLHRSECESDCVMELMKERFEYEVNECGDFPDESDFLSLEFMEHCYREGKTNLYDHYTNNHRVDDKIMMLLVRMIKVVINY